MDWIITAHIDNQTKTVDGVTFTNIHSGQKCAYGDSFYEYEVTSEKPDEFVKNVCCEFAYKCALPASQWREENRAKPSMENHFRSHFEFESRGEGRFFYRVTSPFAD
ncbi:hypothetical protein FJ973_29785 [Mesorhizobium sp. B2-1-3]|uniref:hypothetical protein n=1 Tax=Mesorhizobium sp. B2-1-3 TaxID=2589972 RepID=UPI0011298796|nr:hypothetical protein [Mesorhizobium sp. B2-1-3]TPN03836.1 hypothetical protein FJ973_29785 [Mesorhizobium sp. B2-1-3]